MTIIAVDRSGDIGFTDVWFAAVKEVGGQSHRAIFVHRDAQLSYSRLYPLRWRDHFAAASMFYVVSQLFRPGDSILVDKDYQGVTAEYIKERIQRLFGLRFINNRMASKPQIEFVPKRYSENVKRADLKSKKARHGAIRVERNPNLNRLLQDLS